MCNEVRRQIALGEVRDDFSQLRIPLRFPEGLPNMAPLESIRITDATVIIRAAGEGEEAELVTRRWSWPGPTGKPIYNFRSEGRSFGHGRCLIPVSGFYEFTTPPEGKKRKDKWLFTKAGEPWFAIGGLWRPSPVGEAFTMLTCEPGPDVAPYHSRQMVVVERRDWGAWLDPTVPAQPLIGPLPEGTLEVAQVG